MNIKYTGDDLQLDVYDEDVVSNDRIGSCNIKLTALCVTADEWFEIQHKGKSAGRVRLITRFKPDQPLKPEAQRGDLALTVIEAKLTRDTEMAFNKMDPFCRLEYKEQTFKTKVLQGAGKTPKWNETFNFDVKYIGDDLRLFILDEDTVSSDRVGEATIKFASLCLNGGIDEWFEIQHKGKLAGKVHLQSKFTPKRAEKPVVKE